MRRTTLPILFFALITVGCNGDEGTTGPTGGSLGITTQALLEELVENLTLDAQWVFTLTFGDSRGFAYSLPGVDEGYIGAVTLAPDLTPGAYEPFCAVGALDPGSPLPSFWDIRNRCARLRVDEADLTFFDVYLTEKPHTEPDDRHPFRYDVPDPAGTITYDPNPLVSWRADVRDPANSSVSAQLDLRLTFDGEDGSQIRLAHTGSISAVGPEAGSPAHSLELAFPELIGDESPLRVQLTIEAEAPFRADGSVMVVGETLATIGGSGGALSFQWR